MLFVSIHFILSCTKNTPKRTDFGNFTAIVPSDWKKINMKGIDSPVSGLITDKGDTLVFDYGKFSDPFNEIIEVRSLERKTEYDSVKFRYPSNMIFSENADSDQEQGLFLKEYFYYENINGKKAKLGFPKISNEGRCLLHISKADSLGNKLSAYIKNVDRNTQKEIEAIFKSILIKH
jgi:hypothetical protein